MPYGFVRVFVYCSPSGVLDTYNCSEMPLPYDSTRTVYDIPLSIFEVYRGCGISCLLVAQV